MTEPNKEGRELTMNELDEVKGAGFLAWMLSGTGASGTGQYLDDHGPHVEVGGIGKVGK